MLALDLRINSKHLSWCWVNNYKMINISFFIQLATRCSSQVKTSTKNSFLSALLSCEWVPTLFNRSHFSPLLFSLLLPFCLLLRIINNPNDCDRCVIRIANHYVISPNKISSAVHYNVVQKLDDIRFGRKAAKNNVLMRGNDRHC